MLYTLIIMTVGAIGLQLFADQICGIFAVTSSTQELCVLAIRIITLGFLCAGANITYQGVFQALGYGFSSLLISILRLIIIPLPLAWIFTQAANSKILIWIAFPIAEVITFIVALFTMKKVKIKCIDSIANN